MRLNLNTSRDSAEALKAIQGAAKMHPGDRPIHLQVQSASGNSITLVAGEDFLVSDSFEGEASVGSWLVR